MLLYTIYFVFLLALMGDSISGSMEKKLMKRYNNVVNRCFDKDMNPKPAFACSGLVIRGIQKNKGHMQYAWSLTSLYKEQKAFSFAFLRRDQFFERFPRGYEAGYILYPQFEIPKKKANYKVYCAFPVDANTEVRARHGCGHHLPDESESSKHCDLINITTFEEWIVHTKPLIAKGDLVDKQCAFDMTLKTAARDFEILAQANAYLRAHTDKYPMKHNELRIKIWNEKKPHKLPIQAFFYIIESSTGYAAAKLYRDEYRALTHEDVPIVGIKLPNNKEGKIMIIQDSPCGMPGDSYKIINNMKGFDVFGSHYGAWILEHCQHDNVCSAQQILGIDGHVTGGVVTDTFFKQIYNIYLTKTIDDKHREYYVLKDGENEAYKINGLPNDALLLYVHNFSGVNFFGSSSGAFKLVQGELYALRVPGVNGPVRRVVLRGRANQENFEFYP